MNTNPIDRDKLICEACGITAIGRDGIEERDGVIACPPCHASRITEAAYEYAEWVSEPPLSRGWYWFRIAKNARPHAVILPMARGLKGQWWPIPIQEPPK